MLNIYDMIYEYILIEILNFLSIKDIFNYSIVNKNAYKCLEKNKFNVNKYDFLLNLIKNIENNNIKNIKWLLYQTINPYLDKKILTSLSLILTNNIEIINLFINTCGLYNKIEKFILILRIIYDDKQKSKIIIKKYIQNINIDNIIKKLIIKVFYDFKYIKTNNYKNNKKILNLLNNFLEKS
jgi:hypothetical protein